jgi:hypothetical protein
MSDQFEQDAHAVEQATRLTIDSIQQLIAEREKGDDPAVSLLSVAERNELISEVARIVPAGNVLNFILNGIITSNERGDAPPDAATGRAHLNALFKGLAVMKNNLMYQLAFAGPATILAGYNLLLEVAGANPEDFLPDGAWQFYVEFGLREDAAHHQNETVAFQQLTRQMPIDEPDRLSAWVLAALSLMQDYDTLLELVWEENARLEAIEKYTGLAALQREWQTLRPFAAPDLNTRLVDYRAQQFEAYCKYHLSQVSEAQWRAFSRQWYTPEKLEENGRRKRAYVRQMSLHRYLEPGEYSDERYPIAPSERRIAIVYNGNYYLLPAADPNSPNTIDIVRQQVRAILSSDAPPMAESDMLLAAAPRRAQIKLRATLDRERRASLEKLRKAPIIINWDRLDHDAPLPLT